ncbi:YdeI/OmpD-associated family protein [Sphingobium sp. H39-3-25]|uniref:YdeI/OmpD-associated family protein n=1 Tax=Sphingobium arseniciresistens TaxID=3030834 RepID=UPI0023B995FC|nr:YdeI/OmpD-associated family protein [Sphingobium arseniciresistens]
MARQGAATQDNHDPRVDAYIARQADFARPILTHLRDLVHAACPDVGEAIKWGMPFFTRDGRNLCNMAGFKAHVAFGFWQDAAAREASEAAGKDAGGKSDAMGQFGRLTSLSDLPGDAVMTALIMQASARSRERAEEPRAAPRPARAPLPVPPELETAIAANADAAAHWAAFTPGKIRDYAEWIGEAKRADTRDKRIAEAVGWIAQGKDRNWKYRR